MVISQVMYCIGVCICFTIQLLPAIHVIESANCFVNSSNPFGKYPHIKNIIVRSLLVILIAVVASLIPHFEAVTNLTGALTCTFLSFFIPIMLYNWVFRDTISKA